MTQSRSRLPMLALAAAAGGLAVATALLSRPEGMIGAGFDAALARAPAADRVAAAMPQPVDVGAFNPRHLRPSSARPGSILPVFGPLKVGERVRVASAGGEHELEVIDVQDVAQGVLAGEGLEAGGRMLLLTLRAEDEGNAIVRLLIEEPAAPAGPTADPGRRAL